MLHLTGGARGPGTVAALSIPYSCRFRSAGSTYLSRTVTTSATWAFSAWVKRAALGVISPILDGTIQFNANDTLTCIGLTTTAVDRDAAAWYHIAVANGRLYVNGVDMGAVTTAALTNPRIGYNGTQYFDGYMSYVAFFDGSAGAISSLGMADANGVWVPRAYGVPYGAKGFLLQFGSSGALGTDTSGNGNTYTSSGLASTDQMTDTPSVNYCTLNSVDKSTNLPALVSGGLGIAAGNTGYEHARATIAIPASGKYYFEAVKVSGGTIGFGLYTSLAAMANTTPQGQSGTYMYYNDATNYVCTNGSFTNQGANVLATGTIIQCAVDVGAGKVFMGINNSWMSPAMAFTGDPVAGSNPTFTISPTGMFPALVTYSPSAAVAANFGQRPFTYTPPTGFVALCTANLTSTAVTTSGTFTGNAAADGPVIFANGNPATLTINGNAVTFGTHADKLATGFKLRTSSASYNASGSNTWTATAGNRFKDASGNPNNAQGNP